MSKNIKISVCIPVYNVEQYIARCTDSLMKQMISGLELIFVDDCSSDHSIQILEDSLKKYDRKDITVKIIRHEKNMGVAVARQTAMRAVSGEYFIHCDPDDYADPEMYELMYQTIEREKSDLVYCDFISVNENKTHVLQKQEEFKSPSDMTEGILQGKIHGGLWNKLWRKSFVQYINCPSDICLCEDERMNIQMLRHAEKISYLSKGFYYYMENPAGACRNLQDKHIRSLFKNHLYYVSVLKQDQYKNILIIQRQRMMIQAIRGRGEIGRKLFKNLSFTTKAVLWKPLITDISSVDLWLLRCALFCYPIEQMIFRIYVKILKTFRGNAAV